ncbi:MBG domain-containing protein [Wenzhouxiangella sp. EGI_FJ10305]|uniref:MBG domain-containing protein n=1 Tax=Wenzhouxiangella sp. EGI_FJ10305 TaxID=3243768 RepID=UPI0035D9F297
MSQTRVGDVALKQCSRIPRLVASLLLVAASIANAGSCSDDYCINWYSIGSGGVMLSESADQQWMLSGTIGQWDASEALELTGGSWRLTGGFWGMSAHVTAQVILSDLVQTYTGDPLDVTVTTDPEGLSYEVTYGGLSDAPTEAGSYAVVVTITSPYHGGSASETFTIEPAAATLALSNLDQAWDGGPNPVTVTPDPAEVSYSVTYDGASEAPTEVGEYDVVATITDDNYTGEDATGTLVVSKASSEASIESISPAGSQTVGESYTVTVLVTGNSPTGTVDVSDGEGASCQITLPGDSCQLTSTGVGARTITADYSGNDNHGPSTDQVSYDITPAESGLVIDSVDPADSQVAGLPYVVEISTEGFGPSGTVTVDDGHGESCAIVLPETACELTSTEVGETTLTAQYPGDDNNHADQAQIAYEIEPSGPVKLSFSTEPVAAVVDAPISPAVVVHVLDSTGGLVEDDDETIVTLELETNPHAATLLGVLSVHVNGGIAVFDDLAIDTIGDGYRMRAADAQNELDASVTDTFEVLGDQIHHDRFEGE